MNQNTIEAKERAKARVTFVRKGNGMNCMPPEFKAAIQLVEREMEARSAANGWNTKPDGSVW